MTIFKKMHTKLHHLKKNFGGHVTFLFILKVFCDVNILSASVQIRHCNLYKYFHFTLYISHY